MATVPDLSSSGVGQEEWKELLAELLPEQGAWSEEEYLVLTDHARRLVEFSDGFLDVLPMPTDEHQAILGFLYVAFLQFLQPRGGTVRFAPLRLRIRPGKLREPDLLVLRSATDPRRQDRLWIGADLVLEVVSEDKPERDLVEKRRDYATAGIPEYWIVDPRTATISVLRLRGDAYEEAGIHRRGDEAASGQLDGFSIAVGAVFDAV